MTGCVGDGKVERHGMNCVKNNLKRLIEKDEREPLCQLVRVEPC